MLVLIHYYQNYQIIKLIYHISRNLIDEVLNELLSFRINLHVVLLIIVVRFYLHEEHMLNIYGIVLVLIIDVLIFFFFVILNFFILGLIIILVFIYFLIQLTMLLILYYNINLLLM